jgi:uncharacterized glyoxalase superfamily protein PhnB
MRLRVATPVFLVADIASTMRWYQNVLGFRADPFPPRAPHTFCILSKDDVDIFLQQLDGYERPDVYARRPGGVWSVYLRCDDVQGWFDRLRNHPEITIVQPLRHQPYGQSEFEIRDPNGYVLVIAQPD